MEQELTTTEQKKHTTEIDERRLRVSRLRVQGWKLRDIAKSVGVSVGTVHSDIKAVRLYWKERASEHFEDYVSTQLGVLDAVETEAWHAWNRSIGQAITATEKRKGLGNDSTLERTTVKKQLVGDPRFLNIVKDVSQIRTELVAQMKGDGVQRRTLAQFLQDARNQAGAEFYERVTERAIKTQSTDQ